ncbi:relaxase/mobilization nuclease domain-containing protein [Chitinophaga japonensis]|uniref:Relaxase/mobilization nuclease-like protein n=1 Tax=Chitinophaga japonensis TaxID=104662 RepID=A0A562T6V6_CHIJA|nr:relaxase/mobilization nuclease domain-containing protein [Chitinophaga japonensis]TWI89277.1 relaxase/mobilization nuclease-like protein [Chitinophaga japonensis]
MIGRVTKGKSFSGCIRYCLKDKKGLSDLQKAQLSLKDNLQHKDRAEVLFYNRCSGNTRELARDFREVAALSSRVEKPVLHISLRLAPGETLSNDKWMEIGQACAAEFGVEDHQYICILHKDAAQPHIHIVANRVGFNGKAAKDSQDYRRTAALCRRLEKQYGLREVLSPRAFLSPKERLLPRSDKRKEQLKTDVQQALEKSGTYREFEQRMQALGYTVIKGRGISFVDDKKVKTKGSDIGYSLATLEKALILNQRLPQGQRSKSGAYISPVAEAWRRKKKKGRGI